MPSGTDPDPAEDLSAALAAMAPSGFAVGTRTISVDDVTALTASEHTLAADMADIRRAEFATGRALLRSLADSTEPILRAPNGAPVLPVGVIGSLAHDRRYAVAVVTQRTDVIAIGVDIEPIGRDELSDDEARLVVRHDDVVPTPLAGFVMKEATYKAWSVLGGDMLEHHDVRVADHGSRFEATVFHPSTSATSATSAPPRSFSGAVRREAGYWIALVIATAAAPGRSDRRNL